MCNLTPFLLSVILLTGVSSAQTQTETGSRMEAGIFLDSLSISQTGTTNFGLGARFGYRIHRRVLLEAKLAYDYGLNFHEAFVNLANFRPFATMKAGFIDFRLSGSLLPYSDVVSSVFGLRTSNLNAALYPGAGLEASLGPVGLRLEAGDEIYFNRGAHNNLRITFGPIVRF